MAAGIDLSGLELFEGCEPATLDALEEALGAEHHDAGETLMRQGELDSSFIIVLNGQVLLRRRENGAVVDLGSAGRGTLLGELSMLRARPRTATVVARTGVRVARGGGDAFDLLLHLPGVQERLIGIAARRLAENARPVAATLSDGSSVEIGPLLPTARDLVTSALSRQSSQWLRRRFFTPGQPSSKLIDHLVNIDYVDHFAWGVVTPEGDGVATARYVRDHDHPRRAELAFGVAEGFQGRGVATLLLGALAAVAPAAGVDQFVAEVLNDNAPMRAVLGKAGAHWHRVEPGVVGATLDVDAAAGLIAEPLRSEVAAIGRDVVTAAGLTHL